MSRNERRDLFAAHALAGLLAADAGERNIGLQSYARDEIDRTARIAAEFAEAMLGELDRRDENAARKRKRDAERAQVSR